MAKPKNPPGGLHPRNRAGLGVRDDLYEPLCRFYEAAATAGWRNRPFAEPPTLPIPDDDRSALLELWGHGLLKVIAHGRGDAPALTTAQPVLLCDQVTIVDIEPFGLSSRARVTVAETGALLLESPAQASLRQMDTRTTGVTTHELNVRSHRFLDFEHDPLHLARLELLGVRLERVTAGETILHGVVGDANLWDPAVDPTTLEGEPQPCADCHDGPGHSLVGETYIPKPTAFTESLRGVVVTVEMSSVVGTRLADDTGL
ncbi:MAG TPA: hypothetical protein VHD87_12865 [Acidimicrobiales bacterium]|nr:hypothetical protein [Acidimicrobiales bacterium]